MADSKITALPAIASVVGADLLVIVDDVAGTPATTKGTVTQLGDQILARADLAELIRDTIGTALVDGTGIDVVVDDVAETITINATDSVGVIVEDENSIVLSGATTLNFTGAGVTATNAGGGQVDITIAGGSGSGISLGLSFGTRNSTYF
jgi:hypothetical protein